MIWFLLFSFTKQEADIGNYTPFMYSASNQWYRGIISDEVDCSGPAPFSLITGPSHPWGDSQMITSWYYPGWEYPWWSYASFRDYSISYDCILGYNQCCEVDFWGNCVQWSPLHYVQPSGNGFALRNGYDYYTYAGNFGSGVRTTWQFENFEVTQDIIPEGSSFDNARTMIRFIVRNTSTTTRCYGLRLLLDINVRGQDGAYLYTPNDAIWRDAEIAWNRPIPFDFWIISDSMNWRSNNLIYGNIRRTDWGMIPTEPDRFSYAYWGDFSEPFGNGLFSNVWDDCSNLGRSVGGIDAAVAYWWGWNNNERCLNPNEADTLIQYFFSTVEPAFEISESDKPGFKARIKNGNLIVYNPMPKDILIEIYDIAGRLLRSYKAPPGTSQCSLNLRKGLIFIVSVKKLKLIVR